MATTGVDFLTAGNPVPPVLMYFKNVARAIIPSFSGSSSALPSTLIADSTYSFTFPTYNVPSEYDQSRLRAIILLIDPSNGEVYNTKGKNVDAPATSTVGIDNDVNVPKEFALKQNYPNPFNPTTDISFTIGQTSDINLTIYNLLGQKVRVLENASRQAGTHTLRWDGRDQMGQDVSTGVYLYTLTNGTKSITKKMALMK